MDAEYNCNDEARVALVVANDGFGQCGSVVLLALCRMELAQPHDFRSWAVDDVADRGNCPPNVSHGVTGRSFHVDRSQDAEVAAVDLGLHVRIRDDGARVCNRGARVCLADAAIRSSFKG